MPVEQPIPLPCSLPSLHVHEYYRTVEGPKRRRLRTTYRSFDIAISFSVFHFEIFCSLGALMSLQALIEEKLQKDLEPSHLEVINESQSHHNAPHGAESHFKVIVVSSKFEGVHSNSLPLPQLIEFLLVCGFELVTDRHVCHTHERGTQQDSLCVASLLFPVFSADLAVPSLRCVTNLSSESSFLRLVSFPVSRFATWVGVCPRHAQ